MGNAFRRPALAVVAGIAILTLPAQLFADPGFGTLRKKKIDLQMRRPALVRLANTSIAFKSGASDKQYQEALASLVATLETELVSNEKSLVKKPEGQAEWTLALTITGFQVPQPTTKTTTYKTSSTTYHRWVGTINVAYQVVDRQGRVHDADNVTAAYDKEVNADASSSSASGLRIPGLGKDKETADPRTQEDVKQILIRSVMIQIASNLGNTVQAVEAQIVGGDPALDRAGDFMGKQLWARAIEELEKKPAFVKPEDESYRQYSLGLAFEAMSYESKVFNEQRANLFKAQEYYDKATELNPKQRYFVDVVARTKDSVARYRTLEAMSKDDRSKAQPSATARNDAPPPGLPPAPSIGAKTTSALTIDDVIEMHAASVPSADILELIKSSDVIFALDKDTVLKVAKAKLPVPLQNAMRTKAGLSPIAGAAAPAARTTKLPPPPPPPAASTSGVGTAKPATGAAAPNPLAPKK